MLRVMSLLRLIVILALSMTWAHASDNDDDVLTCSSDSPCELGQNEVRRLLITSSAVDFSEVVFPFTKGAPPAGPPQTMCVWTQACPQSVISPQTSGVVQMILLNFVSAGGSLNNPQTFNAIPIPNVSTNSCKNSTSCIYPYDPRQGISHPIDSGFRSVPWTKPNEKPITIQLQTSANDGMSASSIVAISVGLIPQGTDCATAVQGQQFCSAGLLPKTQSGLITLARQGPANSFPVQQYNRALTKLLQANVFVVNGHSKDASAAQPQTTITVTYSAGSDKDLHAVKARFKALPTKVFDFDKNAVVSHVSSTAYVPVFAPPTPPAATHFNLPRGKAFQFAITSQAQVARVLLPWTAQRATANPSSDFIPPVCIVSQVCPLGVSLMLYDEHNFQGCENVNQNSKSLSFPVDRKCKDPKGFTCTLTYGVASTKPAATCLNNGVFDRGPARRAGRPSISFEVATQRGGGVISPFMPGQAPPPAINPFPAGSLYALYADEAVADKTVSSGYSCASFLKTNYCGNGTLPFLQTVTVPLEWDGVTSTTKQQVHDFNIGLTAWARGVQMFAVKFAPQLQKHHDSFRDMHAAADIDDAAPAPTVNVMIMTVTFSTATSTARDAVTDRLLRELVKGTALSQGIGQGFTTAGAVKKHELVSLPGLGAGQSAGSVHGVGSAPTKKAAAKEDEAPQDGGLHKFMTSFITNGVIGLVVLLVFGYIREKYDWVYAPRCAHQLVVASPQQHTDFVRPSHPLSGFFGWVAATWYPSEHDLFVTSGLDAVMYVKFFKFCFQMFAYCFIYGLFVLLPVNATAGATQTVKVNGVSLTSKFKSLELLSLANVPEESDRLWFHVVSGYVFGGIAFYLLRNLYIDYAALRQLHMRQEAFKAVSRTVLVHNVPVGQRRDDVLASFISRMYRTFRCVWVARPVHAITEKLEERQKAIDTLEHAYGVWMENQRNNSIGHQDQRPMHAVKLFGEKVDSIDQYTAELQDRNDELMKLKESHLEEPTELQAAFITFADTFTPTAFCHINHGDAPFAFAAKQAPEARDVYWPNLAYSNNNRQLRQVLVAAATGWLVFFWIIPVAFVASMTTLAALSKKVPFLKFTTDLNPTIRGFLEGFLPTLALLVFNILLPKILMALSKAQGVEARSWLQMETLKKLFIFQVVNNFLVLTLAGAVFKQLAHIINSPTSIVNLLGTALPVQATFFIQFIMLSTFTVFPLQLLNIGGVVGGVIMKKYLAKTPREFKKMESPPDIDYGVAYSHSLLVFVIAMAYASIAPLILLFGALFFGFGYFVTRYQALYVIVPSYEAGGQFWPILFSRIIAGIIVAQITLLGVIGLKKAPAQSSVLLPLPVLTFLFYRYMQGAYRHRAQFLAGDECAQVDAKLRQVAKAKDGTGTDINAALGDEVSPYLQPELTCTRVQADLRFVDNIVLEQQPSIDDSGSSFGSLGSHGSHHRGDVGILESSIGPAGKRRQRDPIGDGRLDVGGSASVSNNVAHSHDSDDMPHDLTSATSYRSMDGHSDYVFDED